MRQMIFLAAAFASLSGTASAGAIEEACLRSDRDGVSRQLCGCIQQVADMTLDGSDQKQAAKFFADPHMAQEVRQSDNTNNEAFWQRYKNFGIAAEEQCVAS